jgi:NADH-quinone oxidoreductase subunit C
MDSKQQLENLLTTVDNIKIKTDDQRRIRLDVPPKELPALLELLKGRAGFLHLSAISCVDWIDDDEFELVYHLWSYQINTLVSAHIRLDRDPGVYISVYDLFQPAAFFERDIHEMYGLYFEGAPDMEKFILTEWDGPPPMRKEFDSEAWVNEHFDWQDYRPDWLIEIEEQGGGIAIHPEEQRFSRKSQD